MIDPSSNITHGNPITTDENQIYNNVLNGEKREDKCSKGRAGTGM